MGWSTRLAVVAALAICACATAPPPKRAPRPAPPPPPPVRLAVLPVENDTYPKIATAINEVFKTVRVHLAEDYLRPKVTLDVVQLQIECLEATDACYGAVGKSLNVNLLLIGQISAPAKKAKGVRITVTLFNVDTGVAMKMVDRAFRKQDEAVKGIGVLIDEVVGAAAVADAGR